MYGEENYATVDQNYSAREGNDKVETNKNDLFLFVFLENALNC